MDRRRFLLTSLAGALVTELARLKVAVILAIQTPAVQDGEERDEYDPDRYGTG